MNLKIPQTCSLWHMLSIKASRLRAWSGLITAGLLSKSHSILDNCETSQSSGHDAKRSGFHSGHDHPAACGTMLSIKLSRLRAWSGVTAGLLSKSHSIMDNCETSQSSGHYAQQSGFHSEVLVQQFHLRRVMYSAGCAVIGIFCREGLC